MQVNLYYKVERVTLGENFLVKASNATEAVEKIRELVKKEPERLIVVVDQFDAVLED